MAELALDPGRRRARRVGMFHAGALGALLVLLSFVALVNPPATPPPIAEFSPRADQPPDQVEQDLSSQFGQGDGECVPGQECAEGGSAGGVPLTTLPPIVVDDEPPLPSVRRCVGNPPRQIEDPQSPPCAPPYKGPNPGATARGVTANEIVVTVSYPPNSNVYRDIDRAFQNFVNKRFEFYGRQIVLKNTAGNPEQIAEEHQAFAHLEGAVTSTGSAEFARRKIPTIGNYGGEVTEAQLAERGHWVYHPPHETIARNMGEVYCKSLRGRNAEHAGREYVGRPRKLGVLADVSNGPRAVSIGAIREALSRCGVEPEVVEFRELQEETAILTLQQREVTTVVLFASNLRMNRIFQQATRRDYTPEWFKGGDQPDNEAYLGGDDQLAHLFVLSSRTPGADESVRAWYWAYDESVGAGGRSFDVNTAFYHEDRYHRWLILASGIQLAGPNLTPESFASGLQRARFPNPSHGVAPYWQGQVGFDLPADHSLVNDFKLMWWYAANDQSGYARTGTGGLCKVEQGVRARAGTWPERRRALFEPPCEQ